LLKRTFKRTFSAWRFGDKVPGLAPWAVFRRGFAAENVARLRLSRRVWFGRENIRPGLSAAKHQVAMEWRETVPGENIRPGTFSSEAAFHDSLGRSLAKP